MLNSLLTLFVGKKLYEKKFDMRDGTKLTVMLKERKGVQSAVVKYSYIGNTQYRVWDKEDIGTIIHALQGLHALM